MGTIRLRKRGIKGEHEIALPLEHAHIECAGRREVVLLRS